MPYIRITLAGVEPANADPHKLTALQQGVTRLMVDILQKEEVLTVVSIGRDAADCWSVGGVALAGRNAQVQAFITAGTNTNAEKAAFMAATANLLEQVLGKSAEPVYVVVQEIPATDWGYDGLSQAARRQQREGSAA